MLKRIPPLLTPDLLYSLALMGHGDRIAIVDNNYPAASNHRRVHSLSGSSTTDALRALLELFPVDDFIDPAVHRMVPDGEISARFPSHDDLEAELRDHEQRSIEARPLERSAFYTAAADAFAVVHTGDSRPFSCFLITKGVIRTAGS